MTAKAAPPVGLANYVQKLVGNCAILSNYVQTR
jgi:hypothetical protein